jgi:hypothetical protein
MASGREAGARGCRFPCSMTDAARALVSYADYLDLEAVRLRP